MTNQISWFYPNLGIFKFNQKAKIKWPKFDERTKFGTSYIDRLTPSTSWLHAITDDPGIQQLYSLIVVVKAPEAYNARESITDIVFSCAPLARTFL